MIVGEPGFAKIKHFWNLRLLGKDRKEKLKNLGRIPKKGTVHQEIFEPLVRNCRRTLLTQLMDRF